MLKMRGTPFLMSRIWGTSQNYPPFLLFIFQIHKIDLCK